MPKVITSQGLQEFIETGAVTHIEPNRPVSKSARSLETAPSEPVADVKPAPKTVTAPAADSTAADLAEDLQIAESFAKQESTRARLAEERAAELEREKAAQRSPAQPAAPAVDPNKPKIEQFTDAQNNVNWDAFTDAKSEYAAQKALRDERARVAQESHDAAFRTRLADAQTRYPDFLQVLQKADVLIQDDVLAHITDSPVGADITYYLAKNSDEAERIRALHPRRALAEIGKLEARAPWAKGAKPTGATPPAETPKETKQSRTAPAESSPSTRRAREAPAPINALPPSAGAGHAPVDPSKMSYRELRQYERDRAARNRGARR